jgi:hypothetical protein
LLECVGQTTTLTKVDITFKAVARVLFDLRDLEVVEVPGYERG